MFDLRSRVAIVTGGNSGIGLGIAQALAESGAAVVVSGRVSARNAEAVTRLEDAGARAASFAGDLRGEDASRALVATAAEAFRRLDVLVNNAGTTLRKQPQDYAMSEWHEVIDTNLTAAFVCSQAAYPHFLAAGGGKIVNIGSMLSIFGADFGLAYASSKGGLVQMTKVLACAWAKDNIQANAILPGWIDTPFTRVARTQVPGLNEKVLARTPMRRWGDPGDFAGIAVLLASAASNFITGAAIPVDGGYASQG